MAKSGMSGVGLSCSFVRVYAYTKNDEQFATTAEQLRAVKAALMMKDFKFLNKVRTLKDFSNRRLFSLENMRDLGPAPQGWTLMGFTGVKSTSVRHAPVECTESGNMVREACPNLKVDTFLGYENPNDWFEKEYKPDPYKF